QLACTTTPACCLGASCGPPAASRTPLRASARKCLACCLARPAAGLRPHAPLLRRRAPRRRPPHARPPRAASRARRRPPPARAPRAASRAPRPAFARMRPPPASPNLTTPHRTACVRVASSSTPPPVPARPARRVVEPNWDKEEEEGSGRVGSVFSPEKWDPPVRNPVKVPSKSPILVFWVLCYIYSEWLWCSGQISDKCGSMRQVTGEVWFSKIYSKT
ncbi:hypothetical protein BRADI_3g33023v3, partial [Brachypodium distachyon]